MVDVHVTLQLRVLSGAPDLLHLKHADILELSHEIHEVVLDNGQYLGSTRAIGSQGLLDIVQ
jgi:hypothetical protein